MTKAGRDAGRDAGRHAGGHAGAHPAGTAPARLPMRRNDHRARRHPGFLLAMAHRLSGLALAVFLPVHFLTLGSALQGAAALDATLRLIEMPVFKLAEWLLVVLLAVHSACGVRLLVIEFRPWSGTRKNWWTGVLGIGIATGLAFAIALIGST